MTITAQKLLTEISNRSWSGVFDSDFEDADLIKSEINAALRYLINLKDFPFKTEQMNIITSKNVSEYQLPDGKIESIFIGSYKLPFVSNTDEDAMGKPTGFWIDEMTQAIRLFPTPDKRYDVKVLYGQYKPIIGVDGVAKYEFEDAEDYLNIPENLEYLFMDCVIMRAMLTKNKDLDDSNYRPMLEEFKQVWRVFLNASRPQKTEIKVVW